MRALPAASAARAPESETGTKISLSSASASQVPDAFTQSTSPCLMEELPPAPCTSSMFRPTRADMRRNSFRISGCCIARTSPAEMFHRPVRHSSFRAGCGPDRRQLGGIRQRLPVGA